MALPSSVTEQHPCPTLELLSWAWCPTGSTILPWPRLPWPTLQSEAQAHRACWASDEVRGCLSRACQLTQGTGEEVVLESEARGGSGPESWPLQGLGWARDHF